MSSSRPPGIGPVPPAMPSELSTPPEEPPARRTGMSKLGIIVVFVVGAAFVAVCWPIFTKQRKAADLTLAISSLKFVSFKLMDFDDDYGRFPDATTIGAVKTATGTTIPLGDRTSNDFFRQLVADGKMSEKLFWAPSPGHRRKPNDILGTDALAKGECIHSYVPGLSTKDDPGALVAMALMIPGTTRFDPVPYGNKAVVLRADGSAKHESLDDTGHINTHGKDPLDSSQPHWHGKVVDVKWPE